MNDAVALIKAIATLIGSLAWPTAAVITVVLFRTEIAKLLGNIKHAEADIAGQKVSVDVAQMVESIKVDAVTAAQHPVTITQETASQDHQLGVEERQATGDSVAVEVTRAGSRRDTIEIVQRIQAAAVVNPREALLLLADAIERETIDLMAAFGLLPPVPEIPLMPNAVTTLARRGQLPPYVQSAYTHFYALRNQLVHGASIDDTAALEALNAGLVVLHALQAIPRPVYTVADPDVPLYSDASGQMKREDVHGVVIESVIVPDGAEAKTQIFPTTRQYVAGQGNVPMSV